ncbi:response regulator transcription factor [Paraglaciecola sp.]|uniref:response regulator transcription factor n=1 Tax=Paraglaciecola sp. TaxID=1920173 RepID=UPI0030F3979F
MRKKILVIDDEEKIRRFMKISLIAEGFDYCEAANALKGLQIAANENPDVIVLDLGLPDQDGYYVLRELRRWTNTPVLILTARDTEDEKVKLLDGGANDYLSKPFGIKELIARINVLLRTSTNGEKDKILHFAQLHINLIAHEVRLHNHILRLSKKEFLLLSYLARHPQQLISQEVLLAQLWGATHLEDKHYLRVCVGQLRKKLADNAEDPIFIKTVPGLGYIFLQSPQLNTVS